MNKKRGRRHQKEDKSDLEEIVAKFVPCGRCSFFLAGYRSIHGLQQLESMAAESDDEWLTLEWNNETRHLVQKSYGSRLDVELYYLDARCPDCQRRFVYEAESEAGESDIFRIQLQRE